MDAHQLELKWLYEIKQSIQSPFTDTFFIWWDYADSFGFLVILIAIIMYLFNRKEGISLLFIFILSGFVNMALKNYFQLPRPCQIDPLIGILCSKSYGFPSGAAQTATIIAGVAFVKCIRNIYKTLAALFSFLLCFSRIYLGMHFFTDILGGIVIGVGLLYVYFKIFPFFSKALGKICCMSFHLISFARRRKNGFTSRNAIRNSCWVAIFKTNGFI